MCPLGRLLVQLCHQAGCVILNGRTHGDQLGRCTWLPPPARCQQQSVLDYGVASIGLYAAVRSFVVEDLGRHVEALGRASAAAPFPLGRSR